MPNLLDSQTFSFPLSGEPSSSHSQGSSWQASQGSSWKPSQGSSYQESQPSSSDILDESTDEGRITIKHEYAEMKDIKGGEIFSGAIVLVMWSCLIELLSKCRRSGCSANVLPDNMIATRNGKYVF